VRWIPRRDLAGEPGALCSHETHTSRVTLPAEWLASPTDAPPFRNRRVGLLGARYHPEVGWKPISRPIVGPTARLKADYDTSLKAEVALVVVAAGERVAETR
jgi:hypothetical protein